jgi:WD40 repeat protein
MKRLLVCFSVALICMLIPVLHQGTSAASTGQRQEDPSFTIQTIAIKDMLAYNIRVSPDGQTAAIFVGEYARVYLNLPVYGYVVDEPLLPIRLIDLTTGTELGRLSEYSDYVADVAFTPDGKQLASYHLNGEIYLWDIASMQPIQHITAFMGPTYLEFLPDGKTLVSYKDYSAGQFLLWDLETGYMTTIWRAPYQSLGDLKLDSAITRSDYIYTTFDISPDGTLLATATPNGEVMLWDTATLEQTVVQQKAPEDQSMQFNIRLVMFSADGKTLVYFDALSEQTHFWDVTSRTETTALSMGGRSFALSPQNDKLAWATREELWVVDLDQQDMPMKVMDFPEGLQGTSFGPGPAVIFTPDGSRIIVGGFANSDSQAMDNILYVITFN